MLAKVSPVRTSGFTLVESLLMMGLMTILALITISIYLKETDPARKGPGVWSKIESSFVPAFHDAGSPVPMEPDPPLEQKIGLPD